MRSVELRINDHDFAEQMSGMRIWLDSRRFEPKTFRCDHEAADVLVRVEFALEREAVAFAGQFGGCVS